MLLAHIFNNSLGAPVDSKADGRTDQSSAGDLPAALCVEYARRGGVDFVTANLRLSYALLNPAAVGLLSQRGRLLA
jgi:hypothetical protein